MKRIVLLFVLISGYAFSQTVNDYQYVIVPAKFRIFKETDKFRLNTNVKMLLQKYGFKSFLSTDSIPDEVVKANCKILYADLEKDNDFFSTKVKIILKDCKEKVIYQTKFGTSNEKDLLVAYNQALREAGKSFDKLNYKYNGKNGGNAETVTAEYQSKNATPEINKNAAPAPIDSQLFFFAQPMVNGFQIVNNEPRVIMQLLYTSQKNVFIALKNDINGIVINKNGQWLFEYYENAKLKTEFLNLKF